MNRGFISIFFHAVSHLRRLVTDKWYRTLFYLKFRLGNKPRYVVCDTVLNGWKLRIPDTASFLSTFEEIFVNKIYAFPFPGEAPRILDVGANIGLSILFFKKIFPDSVITALEADPYIFEFLVANIHGNGFNDVELLNLAAWNKDTSIKFTGDGADGGHIACDADADGISVQTVDFSRFLCENKVDFLKMDIEGAEEAVFPECAEVLSGISYVFIEYHSRPEKTQKLDRILSTLSVAGFRYHFHCRTKSQIPFEQIELQSGYDMLLNIFAWKEKT